MEQRQRRCRYTPSQWILSFITLSTLLTVVGCIACGVILYLSPGQKHIWQDNGGGYVVYPGIGLYLGAIVTLLLSIVGCCAVYKDSKYALLIFSIFFCAAAGLYVASSATIFTFLRMGKVTNGTMMSFHDTMEGSQHNSTKTNYIHEITIDTVFGVTVVLAVIQVVTGLLSCYGAHLIRKYEQYDIL